MKLKLILVSLVWFSACGLTGFAQEAAQAAQPAAAVNAQPAPGNNKPTAEQKIEAQPDVLAGPQSAQLTPSDNRGPLTLDHELPAAIQFLARMANLNIHIDPSITFTNVVGGDGRPSIPTVSLRWDNVTAEDALQEVLDIHNLMLVINQRTKIARVVRKPNVMPVSTVILQLQHTNPTNVVEVVKTAFSDPNRSRVVADARTGQLVVVATDRDIEAITNLLARLDIPTRQVLIEASMYETARNPSSIHGIDWSGTFEAQKISFGNGITTGTTTTTDGGITTTVLPSGRTVVGTSSGETTRTTLSTLLGAGTGGGISIDTLRGFHPATAFLNADGISAVLSFLNKDSESEVVATPRAVTADNQTARLDVTRAFPIFQTTPGSANTPAASQVNYTNVGTILTVTPRISANDNIGLRVITEVSNIDSKDQQTIDGKINSANVYGIRRIEANVTVPSGNTLVMGGLISDTRSTGNTKVPVLADIPLVGSAFRKKSKTQNKVNLIIFVTPSVVRDQDFQPTTTDFLNSKRPASKELEESAFDSAKPVNWFENWNKTKYGIGGKTENEAATPESR